MIQKYPSDRSGIFSLFAFDLLPILLSGFFVLIVTVEVVFFVFKIIGKILVFNLSVRVIVGILIALEKRTLEMYWGSNSLARANVLKCRVDGKMLSV